MQTGTEGGRLRAVDLRRGIGQGVPDDPDRPGLGHDPGIGGGEGLDQVLGPLDDDSNFFSPSISLNPFFSISQSILFSLSIHSFQFFLFH